MLKHREKTNLVKTLLIGSAATLILIVAVIFFQSSLKGWICASFSSQQSLTPVVTVHVASVNSPPVVSASNPQLIRIENLLEFTYKSCLGQYCMDGEFTNVEGKPLTRIGLLSPDDRWKGLTQILYDLKHVSDHKGNIEIIADTHVPPYGYGRNHGFSRIVRIVDNVPRHAYQLIQSEVNEVNSAHKMYEVQVRRKSSCARVLGTR